MAEGVQECHAGSVGADVHRTQTHGIAHRFDDLGGVGKVVLPRQCHHRLGKNLRGQRRMVTVLVAVAMVRPPVTMVAVIGAAAPLGRVVGALTSAVKFPVRGL